MYIFLVQFLSDTISPNANFTGCPANITTNDVVVNYTEPTASDGEDILTVSCDPPSESILPDNEETTVTCTATDGAGNDANETCTFTVTVGK